GAPTAATSSPRRTAASASTPSCSRAPHGRASPTRARNRCPRGSSRATTSRRPGTSTSVQRNPERRQFLPELDRHLLGGRLTNVDPQALLEAVTPPALLALVEMRLR